MPSPTSADSSPSLLLIHGAWQGSWAWDALLPELAARGVRAHAVDLPGNGSDGTPPQAVSLDGAVEHLADWVDAQPGPVVVVGHSGGGIAASQLAEARPDRIACLIYVAGMMLPSGVSYAALVRELAPRYPEVSGIGPHLRWTPNGLASTVPPDAAMRIFFHDCPAEAAAIAASKLTAQAEGGRAVAPRLTEGRYGRVPRIYIEALQDRSVVLPMQRHMQTLSPGAARYAIDCGHVPQLARPGALADLMLSALARQAAATA